jgi:hypothetical protein
VRWAGTGAGSYISDGHLDPRLDEVDEDLGLVLVN